MVNQNCLDMGEKTERRVQERMNEKRDKLIDKGEESGQ